jgi:hypothetical protein
MEMKSLKIFIVLILALTSLSSCNKDNNTIIDSDKATADVKLNTLFNIKEISNGYIVSGTRDSKISISRLDANFGTVWQRNNYEWGTLFSEGGWGGAIYTVEVINVFQKGNGDFVCFCSVTEGGDVAWQSALIITLNNSGNEISKIVLNNTSLRSVTKTNDDGYLLFGGTLIKLNSDLSKAWENSDLNYIFSGANISSMDINGFAITGTWGSDQVYLQKFSDIGTIEWTQNSYNKNPFNDLGYDVSQLPDKGFLIIGRTRDLAEPWDMNCFLIRTDPVGDTIWTKKFGTELSEWLEKIVYAADNDFIIKETIGYIGDPIQKTLLIRVDGNGQTIDSKEVNLLTIFQTSSGYFVKVVKTGNNIMTFSKVRLNDLFLK